MTSSGKLITLGPSMNSRKTSVLFINRLFGIKYGGGENFDFRLSSELAAAGYSVTLLTGQKLLARTSHPVPPGVSVQYIRTPYLRWLMYRFESSPIRFFRWVGYSGRILDLLFFQVRAFLWAVLNAREFSSVQLCGMSVLGAALKMCGWKTVVRWPGPPDLMDVFFSRFNSLVIAGGDVHPFLRSKISPSTLKLCEVGVDLGRIAPKEWAQSILCKKFLFVGRLVPIKNLEFLIESFAEVLKRNPDISLDLIGPGEAGYRAYLMDLIVSRNAESKIMLRDPVAPGSMGDLYAHYDCLCLVSKYENFPNVILEAMACGLPIIASSVGGIPAQVKNEINGLLVDPTNHAQLTQSIVRMAHEEGLGVEFGSLNYKTMRNARTWESVMKDWLRIVR